MHFHKKIKALGSDVEILLLTNDSQDPTNVLNEIENDISKFENNFSRFKESSELSNLNKTDGQFQASPEMIELLKLAEKYHIETNKVFDPTIATTLERLGYEKSFHLWDNIFSENNEPEKHTEEIGFDKITVEEKNNTVHIPENIKLDLGGIGKGYIIDRVSQKLISAGYQNFWVSIGGDIFLAGTNEEGLPHRIKVQNPLKHDEDILEIEIKKNTGVATSGITKRFWEKWNKKWHHIIDPKTGLSAENDLLAVTVIANNTTTADVFAKSIFILGREKGMEFLNQGEDIEGVLVDKDLNIILSKNMSDYLI